MLENKERASLPELANVCERGRVREPGHDLSTPTVTQSRTQTSKLWRYMAGSTEATVAIVAEVHFDKSIATEVEIAHSRTTDFCSVCSGSRHRGRVPTANCLSDT